LNPDRVVAGPERRHKPGRPHRVWQGVTDLAENVCANISWAKVPPAEKARRGGWSRPERDLIAGLDSDEQDAEGAGTHRPRKNGDRSECASGRHDEGEIVGVDRINGGIGLSVGAQRTPGEGQILLARHEVEDRSPPVLDGAHGGPDRALEFSGSVDPLAVKAERLAELGIIGW
jgi:hypothetical protein